MDEYEKKAQKALDSKNQIKQNQVNIDRGQDLLALMPEGEFTNWLVQVEKVYVVANGDAAYDMRLQCGVSIGSGQNSAGEQYVATAPKNSLIYNQLSAVSAGDFILVDGRLIKFSEINGNDGWPIFATYFDRDKITFSGSNERYNLGLKYFADVKSLAKFTSK